MNSKYKKKMPRKAKKLTVIRASKYEAHEALHRNKKYWHDVFNEKEMNVLEPDELTYSKNLQQSLPPHLYYKVCDILKIPVAPEESYHASGQKAEKIRRRVTEPQMSHRKTLVFERFLDSDTEVEVGSSDEESDKENIHYTFLQKPEREQITWPTKYLEPEREDEKTLIRKADDLTDSIVKDFCDYIEQLGGDQDSQLFKPSAIKELFQIEFNTHAARGLCVIPKELPTVDDKVAMVVGNTEKSINATLEREVAKDVTAECNNDRTEGFNCQLPRRDKVIAPRNNTAKLWRSARHVPQELVTSQTVWDGITNLRSVKEYCRWMIEHPEYRRAPFLKNLGMFSTAVLDGNNSYAELGSR